jgi:hypothetical protein
MKKWINDGVYRVNGGHHDGNHVHALHDENQNDDHHVLIPYRTCMLRTRLLQQIFLEWNSGEQ